MIVVFGCGFGHLITPKTPITSGWKTIPPRAEVLIASIHCLKHLAENPENGKSKGEPYHLTSELVWHKRTRQNTSCDVKCRDLCSDIQELRPIGTLGRWTRSSTTNPLGKLLDQEAVVFGEPKYYHESLDEAFLAGRAVLKQSALKVLFPGNEKYK
jgi:hypothetical protein